MTILNTFKQIDDSHFGDVRTFFKSLNEAAANLETAATVLKSDEPGWNFLIDAQYEQPFFFTQKTSEIIAEIDQVLIDLTSFTAISSRAFDDASTTTTIEPSG